VAGKGRACGGRGRGVRAQNLARHGRIVLGHELVGLHVELGDLRGAVKVAQRLHVPELAGERVRWGLARQDDFDVRDSPHERRLRRVPAPRRAGGVGQLSGPWPGPAAQLPPGAAGKRRGRGRRQGRGPGFHPHLFARLQLGRAARLAEARRVLKEIAHLWRGRAWAAARRGGAARRGAARRQGGSGAARTPRGCRDPRGRRRGRRARHRRPGS
jgi:hypothetical protein